MCRDVRQREGVAAGGHPEVPGCSCGLNGVRGCNRFVPRGRPFDEATLVDRRLSRYRERAPAKRGARYNGLITREVAPVC